MAKFFSSPGFRNSTRVSSTPALPTSERPGSKYTSRWPWPRFSMCSSTRAHELADIGRRFVVVRDAEAAAHIDVTNLRAVRLDLLDEFEQLVDGVEIRADLGDLRADVAVDADHVEIRHRVRLAR